MTTAMITDAPHRMSFFFSAAGSQAAFLCGTEAGLGVGTWAWRDGGPRRQTLSTHGESLYTQPLPAGDGRVLVPRHGAGVHDLVLLGPDRSARNIGRIE